MQEITAIMYFKDYVEYLPDAMTALIHQTVPINITILDGGTTGMPDQYSANHANVSVVHTDGINIKDFNKAIDLSVTPYYVPACADDIFSTDYCKIAQDILDNNPGVDIVSCDMEHFGKESGIARSFELTENIIHGNDLFCSSVVRKSLWSKLGGYDENLPHGMYDDWDFWARAYKAGAKSSHVPFPLYKWRAHDRNVSRYNSQWCGEALEYMKKKGVII